MKDMFDTYKAKVIEGEQATRESRHERETGHELGEWKETTYTKTRYASRIGRERPLRCKIWTRTCLECGYTDFQKNMPYEVKLEKEARAKLLIRRKKRELQQEIEELGK